MARKLAASALAVLALCISSAAWADPPANLASRVEEIRNQVGVPGMAVTIVEDALMVGMAGLMLVIN